jgi:threonine/homoserine/homoserine lactone efflux protein
MTASSLALFALALIVAAGSPGPSVAALVSRVITHGFRDVLPFLVAMWLGEGLWLTLAVAGLAVVAQQFAVLFIVLKFAVAYLLLLAWRMWHAPVEPIGSELPAHRHPWRMFGAGLVTTLGNPKIMVFYVALLPTIVDLERVTVLGWAELTAVIAAR